MKTLPLLLASLALLASAQLAHAKMRYIPMEERIPVSTLIVEAKVASITDTEIEVDSVKTAYKKLDLTVTSTLKGTAPKTLTLLLPAEHRRVTIPEKDSTHFFLLKPQTTEKNSPYELSIQASMFTILGPRDAEELKTAIANEKPPATQPK